MLEVKQEELLYYLEMDRESERGLAVPDSVELDKLNLQPEYSVGNQRGNRRPNID